VVVLGIALTFDVPVFNCSNDVRFVRRAELKLNFMAPLCVRVLQEKIQPPGTWMNPSRSLKTEISKAKNRRIVGNEVLNPPLVVLRMGS